MIGHPADAAMLAWLFGQVEVGFMLHRKVLYREMSGYVCLLRRSRPGATQVRQQWRISLRSLVVDSSCTYHQSQFWIELSCSSALSKSFLDFHCANGSLNFE